jgi:TPP-dependent 2-oxoacid decarboxylase
MVNSNITIAEYLLTRLKEIGVAHIFGVPGDFVLGFFNQVLNSNVQYIGTCNELNAAYAADGYARIRGIGAFSSTYGLVFIEIHTGRFDCPESLRNAGRSMAKTNNLD